MAPLSQPGSAESLLWAHQLKRQHAILLDKMTKFESMMSQAHDNAQNDHDHAAKVGKDVAMLAQDFAQMKQEQIKRHEQMEKSIAKVLETANGVVSRKVAEMKKKLVVESKEEMERMEAKMKLVGIQHGLMKMEQERVVERLGELERQVASKQHEVGGTSSAQMPDGKEQVDESVVRANPGRIEVERTPPAEDRKDADDQDELIAARITKERDYRNATNVKAKGKQPATTRGAARRKGEPFTPSGNALANWEAVRVANDQAVASIKTRDRLTGTLAAKGMGAPAAREEIAAEKRLTRAQAARVRAAQRGVAAVDEATQEEEVPVQKQKRKGKERAMTVDSPLSSLADSEEVDDEDFKALIMGQLRVKPGEGLEKPTRRRYM